MEEKRPMNRMWDFQNEALELARKHGLLDLASEGTRRAYWDGQLSIDELLADSELTAKCEADMARRMAGDDGGT